MRKIILSKLHKTWLIDIDGIVFEHNSYKNNGQDIILKNFKELYRQIGKEDKIIFLTSRDPKYRRITITNLTKNGVKFDQIIFGLPHGERILVDDIKPLHLLKTAIAINTKRNKFPEIKLEYRGDI